MRTDEGVPGCEELGAVARGGVAEGEECCVCGGYGVGDVEGCAGRDLGPGVGGAGVCWGFSLGWALRGRHGGGGDGIPMTSKCWLLWDLIQVLLTKASKWRMEGSES